MEFVRAEGSPDNFGDFNNILEAGGLVLHIQHSTDIPTVKRFAKRRGQPGNRSFWDTNPGGNAFVSEINPPEAFACTQSGDKKLGGLDFGLGGH